jgi:hypothetical protein
VLGSLAAVAGCVGDGGGDANGERSADPVEVREWPDEYYQGPLVSAHEHMAGPDGFRMDAETLDWYVRWMDRNRVERAMAIAPPWLMDVVGEHDDQLVPFYSPYDAVREHLDELADRIASQLDEYPGFAGIGEFGLYQIPSMAAPPMPADHPELLGMYDLAAERDLPVMVHPASIHNGYDDPREPVTHVEAALEHNRETTFLIHGDTFSGVTIDGDTELSSGEAVSRLFERHPNVYYDISGTSPYAYPWQPIPFEIERDGTPEVVDSERKSREWFEARMDETGVEHHAQRYAERYEPILTEHSERVLWGLDASWQWHFHDWTLDTWVDIGRSVLGRLPEEHARNVGYRTAEELFDIEVDGG